MECNSIELKRLVEDQRLTDLENQIAGKIGFTIYKDTYDRLLELLKKDLDNSGIVLNKIERLISEQPEIIERFSADFLKNENIKSISIGFSIMYSVYIIYLIEKTEEDLYTYIVKQKIPQAKKVVKQLMSIKKAMSL